MCVHKHFHAPPQQPTVDLAVYLSLLALPLLLGTGCVQKMANQPRWETEESVPAQLSELSRHAPPHTIPYQQPYAVTVPLEKRISSELESRRNAEPTTLIDHMRQGQHLYGIYCVPCHAMDGSGAGRVPERGYPLPPSYHTPRLRSQSLEHFVEVISRGKRKMPAYAEVLTVPQRCDIACYIRALQFSQAAPVTALEDTDQAALTPIPDAD